jgi:putative ABC transport system permease protein
MSLLDHLILGMANLWRTKLRTILTTLGVTVGIGSLVSMVSFGTGMQKNVTRSFKENDLFTSLYVLPKKVDLEQTMQGDLQTSVSALQKDTPPLDDRALEQIQAHPGVALAFPVVRYPVKIRLNGQETRTYLRGLPGIMGRYPPFSKIREGAFFESDTSRRIILSRQVLKNLKIELEGDTRKPAVTEDSSEAARVVHPDSLLNQPVEVITSVMDLSGLTSRPVRGILSPTKQMFREHVTTLALEGILPPPAGFENSPFDGGVVVPIRTAEAIPHPGFSSIWHLLDRLGKSDTYASLYVRLREMNDLDSVKTAIEERGFGVMSIADQLDEVKQGFIVLDMILGAVGTIALFVASLGIINTMVMSILERTREIGIMKAIGGSEWNIKGIFFIEAGAIGFVGGVFGLMLGWGVTRIANLVANYYIARQGGPHVDFFYIPIWLILGALGFSILVSLLAGLYPAVRAARVDPVRALRHD